MRLSFASSSASAVHLLTPPAIHGSSPFPPSSSSSPMVLRFRAAGKPQQLPPSLATTANTSARQHPGGAAPDTPSPTLPSTPTSHSPTPTPTPAFLLWSHARRSHPIPPTSPGSHRPLTFQNVQLAWSILTCSAWEVFALIWTIHPMRMLFFLLLNFIRGLFPAARSFSQAMLLDQVSPALRGIVAPIACS